MTHSNGRKCSVRATSTPLFSYNPMAAALAAAGLLVLPLRPAHATTIEVGPGCTLVDAVASANDDSTPQGSSCAGGDGQDVIVLPIGSTQNLSETLFISSNVTLQGRGSRLQAVGTGFSLVEIDSGIVVIQDSTISGASTSPQNGGGGIFNYSTLTLINSTLTNNTAYFGGGLVMGEGASATVINSNISGNRANYGGGIANQGGSRLALIGSTVSGNSAKAQGGGIITYGTLSLDFSVVSGNVVGDTQAEYSGIGGGIYSDGSLTLRNSTISGNSSNSYGGGLAIDGGSLALSNSTISGNSAQHYGGGLANNNGTVSLSNSTVSGNQASYGGGVVNYQGVVRVDASTISGNRAQYGGGILNDYSLSLSNSTVKGNSASVHGGGLFNTGSATLLNSTISGNSAIIGGGLFEGNPLPSQTLALQHSGLKAKHIHTKVVVVQSKSISLSNSIVSGNVASSGAELWIGSGSTMTSANNVIGHSALNNTGAVGSAALNESDITATSDGNTPTALADILATTLANNGGFTLTLALVTGSPAIDHALSGATDYDQRGVYEDGTRDSGAYEFSSSTAPDNSSVTVEDINEENVTISTSAGSITADNATPAPFTPPGGNQYPNGFFGFTITGVTPGATVQVTFVLDDISGGVPNGYAKCAGTDCTSVPASVSADGKTVTISLTDGGPLDADGEANGIIVDPGAPGIIVAGAAGISGGAFGLLSSLLLAPMAWLRRRRKKN